MTQIYLLRKVLAATLFGVLVHGSACADIIIEVPDVNITAGGTGFLDVLVSTNFGDNLAAALYEFDLTLASGGSALTITSIEGGMTGSVLGSYVFDGTDHLGQELDVSTPLPGTTFIGSDALDFDPGVTPTNALLTRINILHTAGPGGLAGSVGDQFSLTLLDDGDTLFEDDAFNPLIIAASSFDPGTITITAAAAAAVPEPSTTLLMLVLTGAFVAYRRFPTSREAS